MNKCQYLKIYKNILSREDFKNSKNINYEDDNFELIHLKTFTKNNNKITQVKVIVAPANEHNRELFRNL